MRTSYRIGTIKEIEINLHISLLMILPFFVAIFMFNNPPLGFSEISNTFLKVGLSVLATVTLFISILVHELAHSLTGMRYGVKVKNITLLLFGGVSMLEEIPREPSQEIHIAIVGPVTSFAISGVFYLSYLISTPWMFSSYFYSMAFLNLILAVFNLIPAFPLDGGRILRGYFAKHISYVAATRKAAGVGKLLAIFMGLIGIFYSFWLILIAFFIYIGANEEEKLVYIEGLLKNVKVKDIMTSEVVSVHPDITIKEFLDLMLVKKHMGYPVVDKGELQGIITFEDLRSLPPEKYTTVKVKDVMKRDIISVSPDEPAYKSFKLMNENRIGRVLVIDNGKLEGIVSKTDILRTLSVLELEGALDAE
jgi:CBS domain-containing protein